MDDRLFPLFGGAFLLGYVVFNVVARMGVAEPLGIPFQVWWGAVMFLGVLFFLFGLG